MEKYYSDLATEFLNRAALDLDRAAQYADYAGAPKGMLDSIARLRSGVQNRIKDILLERKPL